MLICFFFFRKQVKKALSCNLYKMITTKGLLNPQLCGFVKAFLYEKSCQKSNYNEILESYKKTFGYKENMNIDIHSNILPTTAINVCQSIHLN